MTGSTTAILTGALLVFACLPAAGVAQTRTYLSKDAALAQALHGAMLVRERRITISEDDALQYSDQLTMPILDSIYVFHEAIEGDRVVRRAVILNVLGQYQPITFIVGILPDGTVERVDIMVYRESRGSEVRRAAFLEQFQQKSMNQPIEVHGDIMAITGATVSSRSVARGVRLALLLHERLTEKGTE